MWNGRAIPYGPYLYVHTRILLAYRISRKDFPAGSRAGFTTDREIVRLIRRADPARIRLEIMGLRPCLQADFLDPVFWTFRLSCVRKSVRVRQQSLQAESNEVEKID